MDTLNRIGSEPYTIVQSVEAVVKCEAGDFQEKDKTAFTEMWHSKSGGDLNTDTFGVPRWWRTPSKTHPVKGHFVVRSKLWAVRGHINFDAAKVTQGLVGSTATPWGSAHGRQGTTDPGTLPYIARHFQMEWETDSGVGWGALTASADLKIGRDTQQYVFPNATQAHADHINTVPTTSPSPSPTLHMQDEHLPMTLDRSPSPPSPELFIPDLDAGSAPAAAADPMNVEVADATEEDLAFVLDAIERVVNNDKFASVDDVIDLMNSVPDNIPPLEVFEDALAELNRIGKIHLFPEDDDLIYLI